MNDEVYVLFGAQSFTTTTGRYEWIVEIHATRATANKRRDELFEVAKLETDPRVKTNYYVMPKPFVGV